MKVKKTVKKTTSDKLRKNALKNKPWDYDRYKNVKHYSDDELKIIYEEYKESHEFFNPINKKTYDNYQSWQYSMTRFFDRDSLSRFLFKLEKKIPKCKYHKCKKELTIDEYRCNKIDPSKRFQLYCNDCMEKENFRRYVKSQDTIDKIQKKRKKWVESQEGKNAYKKIGKNNSKKLKKYFTTKEGIAQIERSKIHMSNLLKNKIKNGEFTPNITNTWTHWKAEIILEGKIYKFRSSWEASFYVSNQHLLYEKLRIPYTLNGKCKTYIADFFDETNQILYEIKPKSQYNKEINKLSAVIDHCIKNKIKFIWINEKNILNYIDINDFSEYNKKQYDKMYKAICKKK